MSYEEIASLPVKDLAAKDCALCLWTTGPNLLDHNGVPMILDRWGFKYKTILFTWIKVDYMGKPAMGLGYYTRSSTELMLLATRGKPLPRMSRSIRQVIMAPRREHSRKPDESYRRIEALFGDVSRVELFARQRRVGWDIAFSNEPDKFPIAA